MYISGGPQESLTGIQKSFLFWVLATPCKDWIVKLERVHFSKVQSGKITLCIISHKSKIERKALECFLLSYRCQDVSECF